MNDIIARLSQPNPVTSDMGADELRQRLLTMQQKLQRANFPVIVLFAGVDAAGKGETANLLQKWMSPRQIVTRAYGERSPEELERPEYWRYWRDLPPHGAIGIFLSAWYSRPLLDRVYENISPERFDEELETVRSFERALTDDGALLLKFWMHLDSEAQKKRLESLAEDPLQSWRVTDRDWKHWRLYDRFMPAAHQLIQATDSELTPWFVIDGSRQKKRGMIVGQTLLQQVEARLDSEKPRPHRKLPEFESTGASEKVLPQLDMSLELERDAYREQRVRWQARLNELFRKAREENLSTVLVFEGWDAGGKGGAIRRVTDALDARSYEVIQVAAPTDEEHAHHYLWRFWRHVPRAGRFTIYDRSWYGRVLVERIEGFASDQEWRRAFDEINEFEKELSEGGSLVIKFWLHITPDEQAERFEARANTPHKQWKLTDEDWRNREKWDQYEEAVEDMVRLTDTDHAPWNLIEGNDKRFARVKVLECVCNAMAKRLSQD